MSMSEGIIRFKLSLNQFLHNNAPQSSIQFIRGMLNGPSKYERNTVTVDYKMMTMQEVVDAGLPLEKIIGMDGLNTVGR